jgi:hypothetical protein
MAKKDPDQIATSPQEELGKEEQRLKLKTAEERTATTSRAMQAFREKRGLMRRKREDGSCCHLLASSLEKTAKRRAHTSKKPK